MSKHVDLIAVGALLLAFAFAARVHEVMHLSIGQGRMFGVRGMSPVVIAPPRVPPVPALPHWPRFPHV